MELIKKENQNRVIPETLSDKIDKFIKWYFENIVKGHYSSQSCNTLRTSSMWSPFKSSSFILKRVYSPTG